MKAVCSCLRSYKRVVEFFHCGANGGGLTGGEGLQAEECVCTRLYVRLCVNTSVCLPGPLQPTELIAQTRVRTRAVCKDAVCVIVSLTYHCAASCKDSLQSFQKKVTLNNLFSNLSSQERRSPSSRRLKSSLPGRRERSRQPQEQTQGLKPANQATMSAKHPKITRSLDQRRKRAQGKIRHTYCTYIHATLLLKH